MVNSVSPATPASDIAVDLRDVHKTYRQRQGRDGKPFAIKHLFRRSYKQIKALNGLNLQIRRGEIVAYAGPNGAGKSTTIKLIAGLLTPDSGQITCLGMNPHHDRVHYVGKIAVVFGQRTELWWDHPVSSSFAWKKTTWQIPEDKYRKKEAVLRARFDLDPIWNSLARDLSLGQRMRADLAMALLPEPELLLLDEPTLGLDVSARLSMLNFIRDLNHDEGLTILITSHNTSDLEELGQRVVLVANGNKEFDGTFDALRAEVGDVRDLSINSDSLNPPTISGAEYLHSHGKVHYYRIGTSERNIVDVLREVNQQVEIRDVEIKRTSIDNVLSKLYQQYQKKGNYD